MCTGGPFGEAVVEVLSETPRTLDAPPLLTIVADLEPAWCLTPPGRHAAPCVEEAAEAVEAAFVDDHSFWLDFESMHVSRQVTGIAPGQAAQAALAVRVARRSKAYLPANAAMPVSAAACTTLATIAGAARRYRSFRPAHAPFVRARDVATPAASWLLAARSSASAAFAITAAPAFAARPASPGWHAR